MLKIHDEILSRQNSEKLLENFFDEVYLTKVFVVNVFTERLCRLSWEKYSRRANHRTPENIKACGGV